MHVIYMVFISHYDILCYISSMYMGHVYEFTPVVHSCRSTESRPPKVTINLGRAEAFEQKLEHLGLLR